MNHSPQSAIERLLLGGPTYRFVDKFDISLSLRRAVFHLYRGVVPCREGCRQRGLAFSRRTLRSRFSRRDVYFFPLVHAWQVDDVADRAVLEQIADMVVDLAVPANPPTTTSASAAAITVCIGAEEDKNPLEPDAGVTSPLDKETSAGTPPPPSKHGPENGRAAIGGDTVNVNGSDTASSVSASAAGDSAEDNDSERFLQPEGGLPSSSVDRTEGADESAVGGETANEEGESIRCDPRQEAQPLENHAPV